MIEHVILHCDNMMQCDCMPLWHPEGPISKWPQYLHDILHKGPFIMSCEKWPVIRVFWILKPLMYQFPYSVGGLKQLQCWVPTCLHIPNGKYCKADSGLLTVNELVSATGCYRNQYCKYPLPYEGQFQDFHNIMKYVLSQLSLLNLVSWPTRCWF